MLSRPVPHPAPDRRWVRRTVQASDLLLRTLYTGVALFGLLMTPPVLTLLLAAALTLGVVVLLAGFVRYCQQHGPARRTITSTAGVSIAFVPFMHGLKVLGELGTAVGLVVLWLAAVVFTSWLSSLAADATSPATATDQGTDCAGGDQSLRDLLHVLPLETLFSEWRTLQQHPGSRPLQPDPTSAVHARTLLLDEMQRRDPAGFAAWLAVGENEPPDGHIHDDQGLPA